MADRTQNQLALLRSTVEQFIQETGDEEAAETARQMLGLLELPRTDIDSDETRRITWVSERAFQVTAYKYQRSWMGTCGWFVRVNQVGQPWSQEISNLESAVTLPFPVLDAITAAFNDAREKGLYPR